MAIMSAWHAANTKMSLSAGSGSHGLKCGPIWQTSALFSAQLSFVAITAHHV